MAVDPEVLREILNRRTGNLPVRAPRPNLPVRPQTVRYNVIRRPPMVGIGLGGLQPVPREMEERYGVRAVPSPGAYQAARMVNASPRALPSPGAYEAARMVRAAPRTSSAPGAYEAARMVRAAPRAAVAPAVARRIVEDAVVRQVAPTYGPVRPYNPPDYTPYGLGGDRAMEYADVNSQYQLGGDRAMELAAQEALNVVAPAAIPASTPERDFLREAAGLADLQTRVAPGTLPGYKGLANVLRQDQIQPTVGNAHLINSLLAEQGSPIVAGVPVGANEIPASSLYNNDGTYNWDLHNYYRSLGKTIV